LREYLKINVIV